MCFNMYAMGVGKQVSDEMLQVLDSYVWGQVWLLELS